MVLIEGGFYLAGLGPEAPEVVETGVFYDSDELLGYKPTPGRRAHAVKRVGDRTVYDVFYDIDEEGRRVTPGSTGGRGDPLVLFFGGSITFGEGVQDDETLPHAYAEAAPGTRVLNYGFRGYGPQQMLAMLEDGRLDHEIEGVEVTAVYTFIDAHVARAVGSMIVVTTWGIDMPRYAYGPDGRLLLQGSFRSAQPLRNLLYELASNSHTLSHLGLDLPPTRAAHFDLTAGIILQSAERIAARASSLRMLVVLHPSVRRAGKPFLAALEDLPLEVVDYRGLWDTGDPAFSIPEDWHPTPRAHRLIGRRLAEATALPGSGTP